MWMCNFFEEVFCHSEDSNTAKNTTLLVSGTPLTAIALFQGSMDQPLIFLESSHKIYVEGDPFKPNEGVPRQDEPENKKEPGHRK